jgi:hypothetical protein
VDVADEATTDASESPHQPEGRTDGSRAFGPRFVTPMLLGSALNPINSSVIATALVAIAAALGVPVGRTSILISSLYLNLGRLPVGDAADSPASHGGRP